VVSTVVGLSRPERVEQTLELAAHPVPDELWPRLEALVPEEQHDPEVSRWT
jgi:D-threo-aldose 1-dehydrogenase